MTQNKRIALNIVATYGRSLYALVVGLFSSRWVLMSLGQTDFGLYGVVGGLTAFIAFFNGLISSAVGRFYAFSIGKASVAKDASAGLEDCRRWFNTAVCIHTILPIVLMIVGYPIGEWAVRHWLTIPPDRINACVWVFRFACITCFISMVNVPFTAMYNAKQYIAELTIYSFVQTTVNFFFLYFMVTHPGDWLAKYAFYACCLSVVPQLIICARAFVVFPECRLRLNYWFDFRRFKELGGFAGCQFLGGIATLLRSQGLAVLINKNFGPNMNAAMSVANNVNYHTSTLATAMQTAFYPVITSAGGAGDYVRMRMMAFKACKLGVIFSLIFVIPLSLELPEVMRIWLVNPPNGSIEFCWCMMAVLLIDESTYGHMIAIAARGRIFCYQFVMSIVSLSVLPLTWMIIAKGGGIWGIGGVLVVTMTASTVLRIGFARWLVGMSIRYWVRRVALPILLLAVFVGASGWCMRLVLGASALRVVCTTLVTCALFFPLVWLFVFDADEHKFICDRIGKRFLIRSNKQKG